MAFSLTVPRLLRILNIFPPGLFCSAEPILVCLFACPLPRLLLYPPWLYYSTSSSTRSYLFAFLATKATFKYDRLSILSFRLARC